MSYSPAAEMGWHQGQLDALRRQLAEMKAANANLIKNAEILADEIISLTADRDVWRRRAEFLLHRRPATEADIKRGQEIWALLEADEAVMP